MSLVMDVIQVKMSRDVSTRQMEMLLRAEAKRKHLIERGILSEPNRKVARAGETPNVFASFNTGIE